MPGEKRSVRTRRGRQEYTCLGCPLTRNRSAWCFRLCTPSAEGTGRCGRIAPHSLKGRTQLSIEHYAQQQQQAYLEKLEEAYLTAPYNQLLDPGVRIEPGQAEILLVPQQQHLDDAGCVAGSLLLALLHDAAVLAVKSVLAEAVVSALNFRVDFTNAAAPQELFVRGRFLGNNGGQCSAEAVIVAANGQEIGRAMATFLEGDHPPGNDSVAHD